MFGEVGGINFLLSLNLVLLLSKIKFKNSLTYMDNFVSKLVILPGTHST